MTREAAVIELSATHSADASELVLRLAVRNDTTQTVYIPTLPVDAAFRTYPHAAYTYLTTDELAVALVLGPSLFPTRRAVEFAASAYHTAVAAGASLEHTLRLPLPLREWSAYSTPGPFEGKPDVTVPVYQVHVFVHAVSQSNAKSAAPVAQHPGLFQVGAKRVDLLRQTLTPDLPLPVVKHPDPEFPRL